MENLNLVELLKDCPRGMELDSTVFDNVTFDYVNTEHNRIYCKIDNRDTVWFTAKGCINLAPSAKCVIFPKGKTTWDGFVPPVEFKDGDILTTDLGSIFILKESNESVFYYSCYIALNDVSRIVKNYTQFCIKKGCRLATEEEKAKLFDAIKANGYKWNAETKTLDKLVEPKFKVGDRIILKDNPHNIPSIRIKAVTKSQYILENEGFFYISSADEKYVLEDKFDITTLKPFESKVLVRDYDNQIWIPTFWGKRLEDDSNCSYLTTNGCYKYCIPYEGNEYLLGTSDDCDDYYKTWEK